MTLQDLKLDNLKIDPKKLFDLGTHFTSFETIVEEIKSPLISDFFKLREALSNLDGPLQDARLGNTRNWLAKKLKELDQDYEAYVKGRPFVHTGLNQKQLRQLQKDITEYFDEAELHDLCMELGIDFENLPGENHSSKARELIKYCKRHGNLLELVELCEIERPRVQWLSDQLAHKSLRVHEWSQIKWELAHEIASELQDMSLVSLPRPPEPPPSQEELDDIYIAFRVRERFDALPVTAQAACQESLNCFACGQYTAAVVLAWHAAELVLGEYYYRVNAQHLLGTDTFQEVVKNPMWSSIVSMLSDEDRIKWKVKEAYELYRNATVPLQQFLFYKDAWQSIDAAISFCSTLVEAWMEANCTLSVKVLCPLDKDIIWALLLLEKYGGGIGRLEILQDKFLNVYPSDENSPEPIGVIDVNGSSITVLYPRVVHDCVAREVARQLHISERMYRQISKIMQIMQDSQLEEHLEDLLGLVQRSSKEDVQAVIKLKKLIEHANKVATIGRKDIVFDFDLLQKLGVDEPRLQ